MKLTEYKGVENVAKQVGAASGAGLTENFVAGSALVETIRQDAQVADELKDRLFNALQKIDGQLIAGDPAGAEIALRQFMGEEALSSLNAQADSLAKTNAVLNDRFKAIHHFRQAPAAGYAEAENRVWLGGFGTWNRQKNSDSVLGYDYDAGGVMLGYDREVAEGLTLGLSGSLSGGKLKNNDGLAETDIKTFGLGLYGSYEFGGGFFVDANLGYGRARNDAKIELGLGLGRKTADFNSHSFGAGLNFGYAANLGEATWLTPSVGLQYSHLKQDGWREKIVSDPDNLAVAHWFGDSTRNFLEIPLSLKLETTLTTSGGVQFTPELRLGGVIAAHKGDSELRMGFVGSGDSAVIRGVDSGQSRFTAGAGLKVQANETVDLFINYDLETRGGYQGHNAAAGLGFSF